jgi:hypothetical protein
VVAIFTKFDDLITQVYEPDLEDEENRQVAERELQDKFQIPLSGFKFPPRAYVYVEGMLKLSFDDDDNCSFDSRLDLNDDNSDHQNQVKELMNKTAGSLDNQALEILFVSVQQNNLELCIRYAVKWYGFRTSHKIAADTHARFYIGFDRELVCRTFTQD